VSPEASLLLKYGLGGWNLAVNGDVFLQGILLVQFSHYVSNGFHRTDPLLLRLWLGTLFVLSLGMTIHSIVITEVQMENLGTVLLPTGPTSQYLTKFQSTFIPGVVLVFYVQLFFCWRIWTLSRRLWLTLTLGLIFTVAMISGLIAILLASVVSLIWAAAYLAIVFVGDALLCGLTVYFLLASAKQVSRDTAGILERLSTLTMHSAAPGAVCALINLSVSQASPSLHSLVGPIDVQAAIALVTGQLLPKFYAFSALWILNGRKHIREDMQRTRDRDSFNQPTANRVRNLSIRATATDLLDLESANESKHNSFIEFAVPGKATANYALSMKDEESEIEQRYRSKSVSLEQALNAELDARGEKKSARM
ncbi:unnamed protein product, partial [Mycena citricolor]